MPRVSEADEVGAKWSTRYDDLLHRAAAGVCPLVFAGNRLRMQMLMRFCDGPHALCPPVPCMISCVIWALPTDCMATCTTTPKLDPYKGSGWGGRYVRQ